MANLSTSKPAGRRTYYDAEPWYRREGGSDWYQQIEATNKAMKQALEGILLQSGRVVEVGCGGGWLGEFILGHGVTSYAGFDFSETAVSHASTRLKCFNQASVSRADALSSDSYPPETTIIVAHQFFHCLIGKDRSNWLRLCRSALLPTRGQLVLSSMIGIHPDLADGIDSLTKVNRPGNRYYAADQEIQDELLTEGFDVSSVIYPEDYSAIYSTRISIAF